MHFSRGIRAAIFVFYGAGFPLDAQNISVFTSVEPTGQTQTLILPNTHTFQLLAQTGDSLSNGALLPTAPDFSAFVPENERNDAGYLSLNHEINNLQGGVTVFDLKFDFLRRVWNISNGLPVDFSVVHGTNRPCSGGVTPWGTVVYGEESVLTSDLDSNQYNDAGWLVEIQPATRQVVQKIWKAGNAIHENCVASADQKTLYWGADDAVNGFIFKYVATAKRQLADGRLYVLVRDDPDASTGTWLQVPNETPEQCNNINAFCVARGAWNFSGIEDVEIGPYGKIYFSAKYSGRIWRFKDNGPYVSSIEVFVENTIYPIETESGVKWVQWGVGADNLAFDNANNLWVLQDGGANNIWMVKPAHTAAHPKVSLFATTPAGCEPTGITFTPNKRFMFLSFQHPGISNSAIKLDVTGKPVVFNRGTTIVIARKEFLGPAPIEVYTPPKSVQPAFLEIAVSPNPAKSGMVTLASADMEEGQLVSVRVFDPSGQLCHQSEHYAAQNRVSINFQSPVSGLYRIQVSVAGKTGWAALMIE